MSEGYTVLSAKTDGLNDKVRKFINDHPSLTIRWYAPKKDGEQGYANFLARSALRGFFELKGVGETKDKAACKLIDAYNRWNVLPFGQKATPGSGRQANHVD